MTDTTTNERFALLMGWTKREGLWVHPSGGSKGWPTEPPDYSTWQHFEDMQVFVRGLGPRERSQVRDEIMKVFGMQYADRIEWGVQCTTELITPKILAEAIVATVGEGVPNA